MVLKSVNVSVYVGNFLFEISNGYVLIERRTYYIIIYHYLLFNQKQNVPGI